MEDNALYLPILVQVTLSVSILFWLAWSRVSRVAKEGIKEIRKTGFPVHVVNASDNYKNQFELPVLFYVLCLFFILTETITQTIIVSAWVFVVARIVHAFVQLTKNIIFPWRFLSFLVSTLAVTFLLLHAFIQVFS
ncbi:hypothetical protein DES40_0670 [Litorimonas taeanensis]|uniref:MAPEG family protein n=1 Tax=Litorimonas taeanensis TaxID=568099 RepID=A0A420WKC2_9PROT|nr:MAPEG family protein [Litorimonas taeanensis]RKQ71355.1 hypothetical protein DES40_0670 [Litorimonas taeanensis]